jgi:hypothetical protein
MTMDILGDGYFLLNRADYANGIFFIIDIPFKADTDSFNFLKYWGIW